MPEPKARRIPKVGMPIVVRALVEGPPLAGTISAVTKRKHNRDSGMTTYEPLEDGMVEAHYFDRGSVMVQEVKYHKGAEYVQTWCWPEEVE